jgi:hypothetical protein
MASEKWNSGTPTITYDFGDAGIAVFERYCPQCSRFVQADDVLFGDPEDGDGNATCEVHGRVAMSFFGYRKTTYGCRCNPSVLCRLREGKALMPISPENARLFAAAPDLLATCKALAKWKKELADSGDAGFWKAEDYDDYKQAMAAIAKAEGDGQ